MPRLSDLVVDSKLNAEFRGSVTIHSYLEIDEAGERSCREEHWKSERPLGHGGFGQVRLERCATVGIYEGDLRAVKVIDTQSKSYKSLDFNRELEALAKFSHNRVSNGVL
jgi:serine/threonine protein kinase